MKKAYLCEGVRTPIGRFGGSLASVRADDLLAAVLRELSQRVPGLDKTDIDDVLIGCANQAGEDNRNVARMSALLAGLPTSTPAATINRLCGSGLGCRKYESRAICYAQGRNCVFKKCRNLRHHHRLALRQQTTQRHLRR